MKKLLTILLTLSLLGAKAQDFSIDTDNSSLRFIVGTDGYLYQSTIGAKSRDYTIPKKGIPREREFYPGAGNGYITEPALVATHSDGNISTDLIYKGHKITDLGDGVTQTVISLADRHYPLLVDITIKSYAQLDIMEFTSSITNNEQGAVTLWQYATASPLFSAKEYWLTQFEGNYKREAGIVSERLSSGIKVLDSKIGVRAHQMRIPSFMVSLDGKPMEDSGEIFIGTLSWPGSFRMAFEVDWNNTMRAVSGINNYMSQYTLEPGEALQTPALTLAFSSQGAGLASANMHSWATKYAVREGAKERPVLLNNWEATHCDFDQQKLIELIAQAQKSGIELFLLDDGWFGDKYPRNDDKHGLGDWVTDPKKLPNGIAPVTKAAKMMGVGFGIWLEPEMVNPKSRLYEQHPEWVITQPNRDPIYGRNQLILDLTRPEVAKYEWDEVIDKTLGSDRGISYVKWDANRYVTQPGSSYLSSAKQTHLLVDYNNALLKLMNRTATQYPDVMMMLCAGGSGRVDYGSLKSFHSFWPSDNTDPLKRVFIQWGFSHIFPANTISAHVTRMGNRPLKFASDVAMSGAYGIDLDLSKLNETQREYISRSVELYKNSLRPVVQHGRLHRLLSPYQNPAAALSYVSNNKKSAVMFVYQVADGQCSAIKLKGLDPAANYKITELNLEQSVKSTLEADGKIISGAELMERGIVPTSNKQLQSHIIGLNIE